MRYWQIIPMFFILMFYETEACPVTLFLYTLKDIFSLSIINQTVYM